MTTLSINRCALSLGVAAALLAGCGGSLAPLRLPPQGLPRQQSLENQAYRLLHKFGVVPRDGIQPAAQLIDVKGTLYGTTLRGGSHNEGTVFSITPSGKETVLHSFDGQDGAFPVAALLNVKGTLYGTASLGGAHGGGTVFTITSAGKEKTLYSFAAAHPEQKNTGSVPKASLIDVNGTLYGTTSQGGKHLCDSGYIGCGTVFSITTGGTYTLLHSFGGHHDGTYPEAALLDVGGTLYGTTSQGGTNFTNSGTVFSISTAGQEQVVYSFGTNKNDGSDPMAPLIDANGTLYGTAYTSGEHQQGGTVFGVTTNGVETLSYSFAGSNGSFPVAGLIDVKGVLYGTTTQGGVNNVGTVFSITTDGTEKVVHSFSNSTGKNPVASLLEVGGTLYGTTYGFVGRPHGNVFSLTP